MGTWHSPELELSCKCFLEFLHKDFHVHAWRNLTWKQRGWTWGVYFCSCSVCTGTCSEAEARLYQPGSANRSLTQSNKFYWGPFFSQSRIHTAEYSARTTLRSKFGLRMVVGNTCSASCWTLIETRSDLEVRGCSLGFPLISAQFLWLLACSLSLHSAAQPLGSWYCVGHRDRPALHTLMCFIFLMNTAPSITLLPSVFQLP